MISRIFRISVVCLVMTFGLSAFAQLKIAVVDPQIAIFETKDGSTQRDAWEVADQPEVDRLNGLQTQIGELQNKLRTDGDILSTEELQDLNDEVEDKTQNYQSGLQLFQTSWTRRLNAFMRDFRPRFNAVLQDLIEIEGYDMVFSYDPRSTNILYMNQKHDITRKMTELLNERADDELPDELTEADESDEPEGAGETEESTEGGE